jgi:hypothetical protein
VGVAEFHRAVVAGCSGGSRDGRAQIGSRDHCLASCSAAAAIRTSVSSSSVTRKTTRRGWTSCRTTIVGTSRVSISWRISRRFTRESRRFRCRSSRIAAGARQFAYRAAGSQLKTRDPRRPAARSEGITSEGARALDRRIRSNSELAGSLPGEAGSRLPRARACRRGERALRGRREVRGSRKDRSEARPAPAYDIGFRDRRWG